MRRFPPEGVQPMWCIPSRHPCYMVGIEPEPQRLPTTSRRQKESQGFALQVVWGFPTPDWVNPKHSGRGFGFPFEIEKRNREERRFNWNIRKLAEESKQIVSFWYTWTGEVSVVVSQSVTVCFVFFFFFFSKFSSIVLGVPSDLSKAYSEPTTSRSSLLDEG